MLKHNGLGFVEAMKKWQVSLQMDFGSHFQNVCPFKALT